MKKGFFVALLMVAVVAMGLPAGATAPTIADLPSIIIGDTGDVYGSGATTAMRLFRYLNVLNLSNPSVIEQHNSTDLADLHVWMMANTTSEPAEIVASNETVFVANVTEAEYATLTAASGTVPAGKEITDSTGGFYWLSLMNKTISDATTATAATGAYTATAQANGTAEGLGWPAGSTGDANPVDMVLLAYDGPIDSVVTGTLVAEGDFTVFTIPGDDATSGGRTPIITATFDGGDVEGWYCNPSALSNGSDLLDGTQLIDSTAGAIGWNCGSATGVPGGGAYVGTWYLGDDGTAAKFLIPGDEETIGPDKILCARATLTTDQTVATSVGGWRLIAISWLTVHWTGISVFSVATADANTAAIDVPLSGSPLEGQIYWAVPYELAGMGDGEAMETGDFSSLINPPDDGRDYNLTFDVVDIDDAGTLLMDAVAIESMARPADRTPQVQYGAGGIDFNDANDGYAALGEASLVALGLTAGTGSVTASRITLTMGTMADLGGYYKASPSPVNITATGKFVEVANDLVRVSYNLTSPAPNICPNVRLQAHVFPDSQVAFDNTIWYDQIGPFDSKGIFAGPSNAVGVPRATGSDIDCYRYTHNTGGSRYLMFDLDAYAFADYYSGNGWPAATGSIYVNSIAAEGGL